MMTANRRQLLAVAAMAALNAALPRIADAQDDAVPATTAELRRAAVAAATRRQVM